jgi:hypothetical protein
MIFLTNTSIDSLDKHQYRFLRNKSTEHSLLHLTIWNKYCSVCGGGVLDVKKAFDTVNHTILLGKLCKLYINGISL